MIQNTMTLRDLLSDQDSHENMWLHRARALHLPRLRYGYYATALSDRHGHPAPPGETKTTSQLSTLSSSQLPSRSRYSSLLRRALNELDWFLDCDFHEQMSRCSVNSIVIALQRVYLTHLRSTWCPHVFRFLEDDRKNLLHHLTNLGLPAPPKYDLEVYQVWFPPPPASPLHSHS
jgi:hypothetical protein